MKETKLSCNYEEMYKQKEAENRYLNTKLEVQRKDYENKIYKL